MSHRVGALGALLWLVLVVANVAEAAPRSKSKSKAKKQKGSPRTALLVVPDKGVAEPMVQAVEGFIGDAASFYKDHEVIVGAAIAKRTRKRLIKCGNDMACVGKACEQGGFFEIIVVRATHKKGKSTHFAFQAVKSGGKNAARKRLVKFRGVDDVAPRMARNFFGIMGITAPGFIEIEGAIDSLMVDTKSMKGAPGPTSLPPGLHDIVLNGHRESVMILPGETSKLVAKKVVAGADESELAKSASDDEAAENPVASQLHAIAAVPGKDEDASQELDEQEQSAGVSEPSGNEDTAAEVHLEHEASPGLLGRTYLSTVAASLAAVGLAAVGVGVVYGLDSKVHADENTSQLRVVQRNSKAKRAATRANWSYAAGGGTIAAAAMLWVADNFLMGVHGTSVAVVPSGSGVSLSIGWPL